MINFWDKTKLGSFKGTFFYSVTVKFIKKILFSDPETILVCSDTEVHSYSTNGDLKHQLTIDTKDDNAILCMSVALIDQNFALGMKDGKVHIYDVHSFEEKFFIYGQNGNFLTRCCRTSGFF